MTAACTRAPAVRRLLLRDRVRRAALACALPLLAGLASGCATVTAGDDAGDDAAVDDPDDPAETAGDGLDGAAIGDDKADGPLGAPGTLRSFALASAAFPGDGHPG